jgi:hypothetical protein
MKKFILFILFILMLTFTCERQDITPVEDEKETKIDSNRKCGCPDDYNIT